MSGERAEKCPEFRWVIRPRASLKPRGWAVLLLSYGLLLGAMGAGLSMNGAWLVLPFMGLEFGLLATVACWALRQGENYESVVIDGDRVTVTRSLGKALSRHEFPRYWARVVLTRDAGEWYPSRLLIGSHGRSVEIGAWMNEEERQALAGDLKRSLDLTR